MQKLALLLLLAATASMIFSFDPTVLAQEAPEEETVEEETSEEEMMEDEMMEDTMEDEMMEDTMEDEMMEDTMEEEMMEVVDSPLAQMVSGVEPHEIQCKTGQTLVFKASNWRPACVNESSLDVLSLRGWVANHDPTHDDLMKMHDDYMAEHTEVMEETEDEVMEETEDEMMEETEDEMMEETEDEMELEEDLAVEEESSSDETDTEGEVTQQSYNISLSESMEMGTQ